MRSKCIQCGNVYSKGVQTSYLTSGNNSPVKQPKFFLHSATKFPFHFRSHTHHCPSASRLINTQQLTCKFTLSSSKPRFVCNYLTENLNSLIMYFSKKYHAIFLAVKSLQINQGSLQSFMNSLSKCRALNVSVCVSLYIFLCVSLCMCECVYLVACWKGIKKKSTKKEAETEKTK